MIYPKWKKEALNIYKSGKKFLDYKRDLLKPDRIAEIQSRLDDLKQASKGWNKEAKQETKEACRQLDNTCDTALPGQTQQSSLAENIEVIFVALVIALGIRCYYIQPFRIPTGSMQPTLNGVVCKHMDKKDWPNPVERGVDFVLKGRGYVYKKANKSLIVPKSVMTSYTRNRVPRNFIAQNLGIWSKLQTFHTVSFIRFENATIKAHGLPAQDLLTNPEVGIYQAIAKYGIIQPNGTAIIPKGTVLYSGYSDSGDLILADKVSYHFRKPKRGETFIFDTRGINTSQTGEKRSRLADQMAATHYIKRCVGIPGDTLQITSPHLIVNGEPAKEPYIQRVAKAEGKYKGLGYVIARPSPRTTGIQRAGHIMTLEKKENHWESEYAAMGDNTQSSLDSRYWGPLREYNVVAPALFSLWPITSGHWGFIQ